MSYFFLGGVALAWHLFSVETNPADSGLSALPLYFLTLPWMFLIPESVTYSEWWGFWVYPISTLFVLFNSFFLYILFGGLKITRKPAI